MGDDSPPLQIRFLDKTDIQRSIYSHKRQIHAFCLCSKQNPAVFFFFFAKCMKLREGILLNESPIQDKTLNVWSAPLSWSHWLGFICFTDMTFTHEGNKTHFDGLVNFEKMVWTKLVVFFSFLSFGQTCHWEDSFKKTGFAMSVRDSCFFLALIFWYFSTWLPKLWEQSESAKVRL